jgi:cyclase
VRTEHHDFQPLGDGIVAGLHRPGGHAICNSGLVDLGGATLVFDTGMTPHAAEELRDGAGFAPLAAPTLVADSHWHMDHVLGNQRFVGLPIYGTRYTREVLLERRDELLAELTRPELEKSVRELEARRESARSDAARADVDLFLLIHRALLAGREPIQLTPPDRTFDTRLDLPGTRGAHLLSFGPGHTRADAVLFLPKERVLFTGDLVCIGVQPSLGSGDPVHWLAVLDELEKLRPERIVPGHGPVVGPDGIGETREYLAAVIATARNAPGSAVPAEARRWEGSMSFEENVAHTRTTIAATRAPE